MPLGYYRTATGLEVAFVLYGERGLIAIEVKRGSRLRDGDLAGIRAFMDDYPIARPLVVYGGTRAYRDDPIEILPARRFFDEIPRLLG